MDGRDKGLLPMIVGPTASGKTALAVSLAQALNGEIVSCDSMQVYRGMPIATAQPTLEERQGIPHHLIGFLDPSEHYSVARFVEDAQAAIEDIRRRGKCPLVVGGTGLYADALADGLCFAGGAHDPDLRRRLNERAEREGNAALLAELASIDPAYAEELHVHDRKRILRALELWYADGVRLSDEKAAFKPSSSPYDPLWIGITFADRQTLYDRIDRRVDEMVRQGLIEEARAALIGDTAAQAIGHKELSGYLAGEEPLEDCLARLKQQTRHYAKRQLSWFRRRADIHWLYADREENLTEAALSYIRERRESV